MGIVLRQSFKNVVATYLGFAIGALNTLFLFTYFLSKAQYGLVSYVTSTATILSPFIHLVYIILGCVITPLTPIDRSKANST